MKWKSFSHVQLFVTPWIYSPWNSPGQNTGVGSCSLLQGLFPPQGLNSSLLHCRRILYQLSHQGSFWVFDCIHCCILLWAFLPLKPIFFFFLRWRIKEREFAQLPNGWVCRWSCKLAHLVYSSTQGWDDVYLEILPSCRTAGTLLSQDLATLSHWQDWIAVQLEEEHVLPCFPRWIVCFL